MKYLIVFTLLIFVNILFLYVSFKHEQKFGYTETIVNHSDTVIIDGVYYVDGNHLK